MLVDHLMPLKEFVALYPRVASRGTLRRWIREDYKGFKKCAVRSGKQKYSIDLDAVNIWLEEQRVSQQGKK